jgi:tRNA(adenine34) deaminase
VRSVHISCFRIYFITFADTKVQIIMERIDRKDDFFMRMAINEASAALKKGEVPIGAVVVCGDRVVGRGHNLTESLGDATAHAEMQAITAAAASLGGKYLDKCTLYVTVEPCVMCAGACYWSQLGEVVWGADDPKRGFSTVGGRILHPKTKARGGVLAEECGAIVSRFFEKLRQ